MAKQVIGNFFSLLYCLLAVQQMLVRLNLPTFLYKNKLFLIYIVSFRLIFFQAVEIPQQRRFMKVLCKLASFNLWFTRLSHCIHANQCQVTCPLSQSLVVMPTSFTKTTTSTTSFSSSILNSFQQNVSVSQPITHYPIIYCAYSREISIINSST